ncbi:rod shape-determining protein [Streptomyces sp. NPDC017943]|uniref:rod shape-determining protein n=1 Tax=Streptomyces sp. NPDC017943 TaxID=3365019 RepID=UPI003792B93B
MTALPVRSAARHRFGRHSGIALEMGSARTRVWLLGRGLISDVPTVTFGTDTRCPVQRGTIIDPAGCARMLERLLGHRLPRFTAPHVVVTTPVLGGPAYRDAARAAVEVLRPRTVLTVPTARAIALAAGAGRTRPLLVVDVGAHLSEVVLLADTGVVDARRTALGTSDLDATPPERVGDAVADMVSAMLRQDGGSLTADALSRGVLLAGGGALRPDITYHLTARLQTAVRVVPAPHTAAVRGAAQHLLAARSRPRAADAAPPGPD